MHVQGRKFEVDAGSLGFAVTLFSILAVFVQESIFGSSKKPTDH